MADWPSFVHHLFSDILVIYMTDQSPRLMKIELLKVLQPICTTEAIQIKGRGGMKVSRA